MCVWGKPLFEAFLVNIKNKLFYSRSDVKIITTYIFGGAYSVFKQPCNVGPIIIPILHTRVRHRQLRSSLGYPGFKFQQSAHYALWFQTLLL